MISLAIKRSLDFIVALLLLLLFSPLLLACALLIRTTMGAPVFFRQKRPGHCEQIFTLIKFRTMTVATNESGVSSTDAIRITPVGCFLRASSLDELPQLINVLAGDLSLVGPRPLLVEYLERYDEFQRRRHDVKPGITGWAQVNGRNALTWKEKFEYDLWYVENWSLGLDLKILAMTIWKVLSMEGIRKPGHATTKEFRGNDDD
jgi:sugar transferase EpsL